MSINTSGDLAVKQGSAATHVCNLQVIYRGANDRMSEEVVRWCDQCGAVVVDLDYDGRIRPGAVRPKEYPKSYRSNL